MKNGLINTVLKDTFLDVVLMPKLIAITGGIAGLPVIKQFIRWVLDQLFVDATFDEMQRLFNFGVIDGEETAEGDRAVAAIEKMKEHEDAGLTEADLETDEQLRKDYEAYKNAVREHITSGRRGSH